MTVLKCHSITPHGIIKALENESTSKHLTQKELFKGLSLALLYMFDQDPPKRPFKVEFEIMWKFSRMFNPRIPKCDIELSLEIYSDPAKYTNWK